MSKLIQINVTDRRAQALDSPVIICGNKGYRVKFIFDSEWESLNPKTARFAYVRDGQVGYQDIVFEGDSVAVPILSNIREVNVGVFAGDLCTTTPAVIPCERSILCGSGEPEAPSPSVYAQIIKLFNQKVLEFGSPVENEYNPTSTNAQSGVAVATALRGAIDSTRFISTSTKAQSGLAVSEAMSQATDMIDDRRNLLDGVGWVEGESLNQAGEAVDNTSYKRSDGKIYVMPNTTYSTDCSVICFYNSKSENITDSTRWGKGTFTTSADTYYVRVAIASKYTEPYFVKGTYDQRPNGLGEIYMPDLSVGASNLREQSITGKRLYFSTIDEDRLSFVKSNRDYFKKSTCTDDTQLKSTGETAAATGWFVSDFIEVKAGATYNITEYPTSYNLVGYNRQKYAIGVITHTKGVFTAPDNCVYIRLTNLMDKKNKTAVFRSTADQTQPNTFTMDGLRVGMDNLGADVLGAVKAPVSSILADLIFTTETKRIKLIGDSITHGMGSSDFKQSTDASDFLFNAGTFPQYRNYGVKCWAGMLKSYLEEKFNCSVVNNGASGASSKQLVDNWDAIVSADDDVIICMIGTNDRNGSLSATYQNLVAIYEKAQAKGQRIIFMSAPPASNENEEQATAFHLEDLDNLYNYADNTLRVGYISVYKAFINYCRDTGTKIDDLLSDGLHPNDEGYQIMYEIVLEALGFGRKRDKPVTRSNTDYLYESYNVDKATFPYVMVGCTDKGDGKVHCQVYFANKFSDTNGRVIIPQGRTYKHLSLVQNITADINNQDDVVDKIVAYNASVSQATASSSPAYTAADTTVYYTNDTADTFTFVPEYLT